MEIPFVRLCQSREVYLQYLKCIVRVQKGPSFCHYLLVTDLLLLLLCTDLFLGNPVDRDLVSSVDRVIVYLALFFHVLVVYLGSEDVVD